MLGLREYDTFTTFTTSYFLSPIKKYDTLNVGICINKYEVKNVWICLWKSKLVMMSAISPIKGAE